jgi:hypothetical protein
LPKNVKEPNDILVKGNYAEIVIRNALGEQKAVAIIDKDDLERCSKLKWSWGQTAIQAVYKGKRISLSRFILGVTEKDKFAIHKDGDFLNNRRSNLVVATKQQKAINAKTGSRNTSGYRGISWRKDRKKWDVYLIYNGKMHRAGCCELLEDAIAARKALEEKYYKGLRIK